MSDVKIAITGGTGFVGKELTDYFLSQNHEVIILTRNVNKQAAANKKLKYVEWLTENSQPELTLEDIDAIIHLAGQSINDRWTKVQKENIFNSRIQATKALTSILCKLSKKPKVVISASAIGIYGTSLNETFTENSTKYGHDFLAKLSHAWETETSKISELGIRTVTARFGIILGKTEGALPKMVFPYKLYIGGKIGSGKQWVSWIHIQDVLQMIHFLITHPEINGIVHATAPTPVTMEQFGRTIGKVLRRPHWIPVPGFALKLLLGEMSMLVLEGQKVLPERIQKLGYEFTFTNVEEALYNILRQ